MHAVRVAGLLLALLTGGCTGLERASQGHPRGTGSAGTGALDLLVLPAAFTQEPTRQLEATPPDFTLQQRTETPAIGEGERQ